MKKLLLFLVLVSFSKFSFAQSLDHDMYLHNIVSVDEQRFGLIIGQEGETFYFITADQASVNLSSAVKVQFYASPTIYEAKLVKTFRFGESLLYLYAVVGNKLLEWLKGHYQSSTIASSVYKSFIKDGYNKAVWHPNQREFFFNRIIIGGQVQFTTINGVAYHPGMPLVNKGNRITGIISSSTTDANSSAVITAIDISAIAESLTADFKCKYFQLIEAGHTRNRCETEQRAAAAERQAREKVKRDGRTHIVAIAPGVGGGVTFPAGGNSEAKALGPTFGAGLNIVTNPDAGRIRVAVKPWVSFTKMDISGTLMPNPNIGFESLSYNWSNIDVPVFAEFVLGRKALSATYIGVGYSLGYQSDINYEYRTYSYNGNIVRTTDDVSGFVQKPTVEVGIERKRVRLSLFASYQLTPWNKSSTYTISNAEVNPFESLSRQLWRLGLVFSFRLNGRWEMKTPTE